MIERGNILLSFALIVIAIVAISLSWKWSIRAAIFPVVISIPIFIMALAELIRNLFEKKKKSNQGASLDIQGAENMDSGLVNKEDLLTFCWIAGFFLLIFFLGFTIAIPILIFLYLKYHGDETWGIVLIFTGLSWLFFYGLFVKLLQTPFTEGWLIKMLKAI